MSETENNDLEQDIHALADAHSLPGIIAVLGEWVVLENSNVEKLASNQYLLVQSRSKEDRYDINDASAGEVYSILVPESTVSVLQSSRRREHRPSVVDRQTQPHRTATLHGMRPGILRTGGDPDGPEQTPRSNCDPTPEMSTVGCL